MVLDRTVVERLENSNAQFSFLYRSTVSHPWQKVHSVIYLLTYFLFRQEKREVYAAETLLFGLEWRMISSVKNTYGM